MNCALAIAISHMYQEPELVEVYRGTAYWDAGNRLLKHVDDAQDDAVGDTILVDQWARGLGIWA